MATSKPDTIGSQFFITYARQNHLNNVNTVIGQCVHCSFGLFPRPHAALRPLQMARTSPFLCVCVFVSMCVLRAMWWTWHIGVDVVLVVFQRHRRHGHLGRDGGSPRGRQKAPPSEGNEAVESDHPRQSISTCSVFGVSVGMRLEQS